METDFFDNVAGVLQGDTLAPYLFIILDYILLILIDLMKENGFTLKSQEVDDTPQKLLWTQLTVLLANTPVQDEFLLHSLEQG